MIEGCLAMLGRGHEKGLEMRRAQQQQQLLPLSLSSPVPALPAFKGSKQSPIMHAEDCTLDHPSLLLILLAIAVLLLAVHFCSCSSTS